MERRLRAARRKERRARTGFDFDQRAEAGPDADPIRLTPAQAASWALASQGVGPRPAARILGITPQAHRDRLARAGVRLRPEADPARAARMWVVPLIRHLQKVGDCRHSPLLVMHGAGRRHAECAKELGLAPATVRVRLHRLRRLWVQASKL